MSNSDLLSAPEWTALENHYNATKDMHIRDLFKADLARFGKFHIECDGLLFDYSKNRITEETRDLLCDLARARGLEDWRARMFGGEIINDTEQRAVLHTALRSAPENLSADGENVAAFREKMLSQIEQTSEKLRNDKAITDVVNIGIGGSSLGPMLVCEALAHMADGPRVHFVSNVDGAHIGELLNTLKPQNTAFIVTSKTFTTQETLTNARTARNWIEGAGIKAIDDHFYGVTMNDEEAAAFGIAQENILPMREWIGGRYSVWSAVGLPVAAAIGFENFKKFLNGAAVMDRHFLDAPLDRNMPVMMAMIGLWHRNFCHYPALAILPYAQSLRSLPAYLQQLDMESNGKSVDRNGQKIAYGTAPIVFGEPGTDGQHAFFQCLHQGTDITPCDFIAAVEPTHNLPGHHEKLLANMLAQSKAMMDGKDETDPPHKRFDGNRPSSTLLLERLDPRHIGMLLALYEHKVFVQGVIWNINSFDQWGVELGKVLAKDILKLMGEPGQKPENTDSSTAGLLHHLQKRKIS